MDYGAPAECSILMSELNGGLRMNPELPQAQPGYRPTPPLQVRSDREVLTPNQRIVFFAAHLFTYFGWLIAAAVIGYTSWRSDFRTWVSADSEYRGDSPSLAMYTAGSVAFVAAVTVPLILILIVIKNKLRTYMLERPFH